MKRLAPLLFLAILFLPGVIVQYHQREVAALMGKLCGWETDDNPWTNPNYYKENLKLNVHPQIDFRNSGPPQFRPPHVSVPASNPYVN